MFLLQDSSNNRCGAVVSLKTVVFILDVATPIEVKEPKKLVSKIPVVRIM
jgi:hypothetical protein